ncbi:MAG TPA: UDP-N-acetylglucosamine 1-carboxyvinyltransferase, partial [Clostridiales bacterium]|nr:UDP-N-acetylglucosamine 1-carboxyvinyltransferase [Clostridiales bacterium]
MPDYKLVIEGGRALRGETQVSGGKNTSLAVIPATILAEGPCLLDNLPDISDVRVLVKILSHLGAKVTWNPEAKQMGVDPSALTTNTVPFHLSQRMRASYYLMGALLGRYGYARVGYPGGCDLGSRPIDQHLKGFRALGATITEEQGMIVLEGKLKGANINFDMVTVGGTINVMLAACRAEGDTVLTNCAKEPHIVDTANFLNRIGAHIRGAGTDTIRIRGVAKLDGA